MIGPVLEEKVDKPYTWNRSGLDKIRSYGNDKHTEQFKAHTEKWNSIRKLNIYDHVPELSLIV